MNRTDHLLTKLDEECHEVGQRVCKALRFGLQEKQKGQEFTNAERIMHEFADLVAAIDMLEEENILKYPHDWQLLVSKKKQDFENYLEISKEQGRLDV